MKVGKGQYGYNAHLRKVTILKTVLFFGVSIALFIAGYIQTGTRNNVLTVAAILGCLPASKSAVIMIMAFCAKGCSRETADLVKAYENKICLLYDCYMTSEKKSFDIACMAVTREYIYGYTENSKTEISVAEKHIQDILKANKKPSIPVKILNDKNTFVQRLQDMEKNAEVDINEVAELANILKAISL